MCATLTMHASTLLRRHAHAETASLEYFLTYSGPKMTSEIARITNVRNEEFSVVLASVTDTTRKYELIDDTGVQQGSISILALPRILMLDQVAVYSSVRGQLLCTPFVTAALRDTLTSYGDARPSLARVFVSTEYPRSAVNCYINAFRAVDYDVVQEPRPIHPVHEEGGEHEYVSEIVFAK